MKNSLYHVFREKKKTIILLVLLFLAFISIGIFENYITLFFLFLFAIVLSIKVRNYFYIINLIKKFDQKEIEKIEKESNIPLLEYKNNFLITNSYIIRYGFVDNIVKHEDIIMIYIDKTINTKSFDTHLVVITKTNKKYKYLLEHASFLYKDDYFDILTLIKQRNWDILIGYNKLNVDLIKEKYGFKIIK